jgi:hypothetical protein
MKPGNCKEGVQVLYSAPGGAHEMPTAHDIHRVE